MRALLECTLYAFVDTAFLRGRPPELLARQLCEGGADIIQLRAKGSSAQEVLGMAKAILPVTRKAGVLLVINDFLDAALECGAEYCHLGQEDFFGAGHQHVSEILPPGSQLQIGLSSHEPEQAERAVAAGAAYLGVGPVYATGTKPEAKAVTLEYVRWAAGNLTLPWFAIGGINLQNVDEVRRAGARGICAVSAILNAEDVAGACRDFQARLKRD
jgi:thiamine-phosphate pyrophosphorylase